MEGAGCRSHRSPARSFIDRLIRLPGTYSETGEVVALARWPLEEDGIYASAYRERSS